MQESKDNSQEDEPVLQLPVHLPLSITLLFAASPVICLTLYPHEDRIGKYLNLEVYFFPPLMLLWVKLNHIHSTLMADYTGVRAGNINKKWEKSVLMQPCVNVALRQRFIINNTHWLG